MTEQYLKPINQRASLALAHRSFSIEGFPILPLSWLCLAHLFLLNLLPTAGPHFLLGEELSPDSPLLSVRTLLQQTP